MITMIMTMMMLMMMEELRYMYGLQVHLGGMEDHDPKPK
jgi:hypothetical protein